MLEITSHLKHGRQPFATKKRKWIQVCHRRKPCQAVVLKGILVETPETGLNEGWKPFSARMFKIANIHLANGCSFWLSGLGHYKLKYFDHPGSGLNPWWAVSHGEHLFSDQLFSISKCWALKDKNIFIARYDACDLKSYQSNQNLQLLLEGV